jgi:hypothetical protein
MLAYAKQQACALSHQSCVSKMRFNPGGTPREKQDFPRPICRICYGGVVLSGGSAINHEPILAAYHWHSQRGTNRRSHLLPAWSPRYQHEILRQFWPDNTPFTFVSDEFNGLNKDVNGNVMPLWIRHFQSFHEAEQENAQSRIYLGIHWQFDADMGIQQGNLVADYVFQNAFMPSGQKQASVQH